MFEFSWFMVFFMFMDIYYKLFNFYISLTLEKFSIENKTKRNNIILIVRPLFPTLTLKFVLNFIHLFVHKEILLTELQKHHFNRNSFVNSFIYTQNS